MPEPSSPTTGVLHEIRWNEICPWLILVKALRVSLMLRVLVLATVGMMLTLWGDAAIDKVISGVASPPAQMLMPDVASQFHRHSFEDASPRSSKLMPPQSGAFLIAWQWMTKPFVLLCSSSLSEQATMITLLHGIWRIVVWGIFGGAIARIAAVFLTRGKTISPLQALREATTVWPGTTGAPVIVLCVAGVLGLPLVLLGSLFHFNILPVVIGVLWCLVLVLGLMLAAVLIGLLIGWPLIWACLGVERSDAFDGVSRCYAYVYQRPLHLAFYVLVATVLTMFGEFVLSAFARATTTLSEGFFLAGTNSSHLAELLSADPSALASQTISVWKWAFESLVAAYPLACLWPMAVGIYLLLRRQVDATEIDEISLPAASPEAHPAPDPTAPE